MTDKQRQEIKQQLETLELTLKNRPDDYTVQTFYPRWIKELKTALEG